VCLRWRKRPRISRRVGSAIARNTASRCFGFRTAKVKHPCRPVPCPLWVISRQQTSRRGVGDVRFTPESGQRPACLLCAKSGHSHCSKFSYSITWSARKFQTLRGLYPITFVGGQDCLAHQPSGVAYSSSFLGWVCCCCWSLCANRSHTSAMWDRVARVLHSLNAAAISRHCCARRRYSSALFATAYPACPLAPRIRLTAEAIRWPNRPSAQGRSRRHRPGG